MEIFCECSSSIIMTPRNAQDARWRPGPRLVARPTIRRFRRVSSESRMCGITRTRGAPVARIVTSGCSATHFGRPGGGLQAASCQPFHLPVHPVGPPPGAQATASGSLRGPQPGQSLVRSDSGSRPPGAAGGRGINPNVDWGPSKRASATVTVSVPSPGPPLSGSPGPDLFSNFRVRSWSGT